MARLERWVLAAWARGRAAAARGPAPAWRPALREGRPMSLDAREGTRGSSRLTARSPPTTTTSAAQAGATGQRSADEARAAARSTRLCGDILSFNLVGPEKLRAGGTSYPPTLGGRGLTRAGPRLRRRWTAGLKLLALAGATAVASCGGGGEEDVQSLLDKAFKRNVGSADLKIDAELRLEGVPSLNRPVRIRASGPYRENRGRLPSLDLEVSLGTDGGGQTIATGFLSTGDRAFVKFQDVYYEQSRAEVARTNRQIRERSGRRSSLRALGLNPRSWLAEAEDGGEEEVVGETTVHVTGKLDVARVLRDLNQLLKAEGGAFGSATSQRPPDPLTEGQVQQAADAIKDPTFDVYVGKDDDIVRRVAGRIKVDVPKGARAAGGAVEGGSLRFSVELSDVNGDQRIEAPSKARPLSDLTKSLGAGTLPGLGGGVGSADRRPAPSEAPSGSSSERFKDYSACLEKANPRDTVALQRCADLLE